MKLCAFAALAIGVLSSFAFAAEPLDPSTQAKVDAIVKDATAWASDPVLANAAKEQNANPSADVQAMTQEKWASLSLMDPFVRSFAKNPVGQFLKSKKSDIVTEAFASSADGRKLGFLSKTTGWSHKGKDKHEMPMAGKNWQGKVEMDESTGLMEVQVSVPVLDGGKPVGSLVLGLNVSKLKE
jgi:hypothetical protein